MKIGIQILIVCMLVVGCVSTPDSPQQKAVAAAIVPAEETAAVAEESSPAATMPAEELTAPVNGSVAPPTVEPAAEKSAPVQGTLEEESRKQFVAGDLDGAEAGFEAVLETEPENKIATLYLQQIKKTRHLKTEDAAMEEVEDAWGDCLETRYYSLGEKVLKNMGLSTSEEPKAIEEKFPFVEFPEGASATYRPKLKKIFVRNTPENLKQVEHILEKFQIAEQQASVEQVKIETRFVEFNEGALQELGFNWSDRAGDGNAFGEGHWSLNDGVNLFTNALRSVPFDQTSAQEISARSQDGRLDSWNVNRIEDMFNTGAGTLEASGKLAGNTIDLLIRALDQTAGVDVLSAPSIVTLSGEPATITVGERHFYPKTYAAGRSQGAVVHVMYEEFMEKILGVEMTVTPTIKGDEIKMKINPKITELIGWQQFEISPADTSYNYYQYRVGQIFQHDPVVAQLPLFNRREVKTEISVASGATLGMGGLIGEKKESFSDRVPVLGSIPLIGRLFRSEGSRTVKRNLMIFVTASKVAPSGRIISDRSVE